MRMKALVYRGPKDVRIENMPDPKIEKPTDVLVKITTTNICGSDLHIYDGRTDMEKGRIFGGQANVKCYNRELCALTSSGKATFRHYFA